MPIAKTISEIVSDRKNRIAPKYKECWGEAIKVVEFALQIESLINSKKWQTLLGECPEFKKQWDGVKDDVLTFIEQVREQVGKREGEMIIPQGYFELINNKIQKEVVEVCVTGPVSSGKSVLMRALTGAPEQVIPSGSNKTTAARTIFNNSSEKNIGATITFLSSEEFSRIINEYVKQLNKVLKNGKFDLFQEWNYKTESIETFCIRIQESPSYNSQRFGISTIEGVDTTVTANKYFETFQLYIDNVADYKDVIDREQEHLSKTDIDAGKLVPYVSYLRKIGDDSKKLYCLALGVKEAIVNWPLQTIGGEELGNLQLVDTMGIGEAKFCVETDLLEIVKKHADIAIALCRIKSNTENLENSENSSFIKVLTYLKNRKMEDWVFYLCNKESGVGISEDKTNDLRDQIWKEMRNNSDSFDLNKSYWRALEFMSNGQENSEQILEYFIHTVLGNLQANIKDVDAYFISELEKQKKIFDTKKADIISKMKSCAKALPNYSKTYRTEAIDTEVASIYVNLEKSLSKFKKELFARDKELQEQIINSILPILKNPEIFNIYGVDSVDFDATAAFNPLFLRIIREINYTISISKEEQIEWKDIKGNIISRVAEIQRTEESEIKKLIDAHEAFFKKFLESSCKAIDSRRYDVKSNLNIDDPNKSLNTKGRELEFFLFQREELYRRIWHRAESSEQLGVNEKDIRDVKEKLCETIRNVFVTNNVVESHEELATDWFMAFARLVGSDALLQEVENFVNAKIDLPTIVDEQTGKELRRNLLMVNLNYSDELSAARSIWYSLFNLDIKLRLDWLRKYKHTFSTYDVFINLVTPIFDNVVCLNQNEEFRERVMAYTNLRAYIKELVTSNFDKKPIAMCAEATKSYKELCNN